MNTHILPLIAALSAPVPAPPCFDGGHALSVGPEGAASTLCAAQSSTPRLACPEAGQSLVVENENGRVSISCGPSPVRMDP